MQHTHVTTLTFRFGTKIVVSFWYKDRFTKLNKSCRTPFYEMEICIFTLRFKERCTNGGACKT